MLFLAEGVPENPNPVIPIWQEIVVGSIAFALLCWVLMKFVFPRMEETFKARVEAIAGHRSPALIIVAPGAAGIVRLVGRDEARQHGAVGMAPGDLQDIGQDLGQPRHEPVAVDPEV